MTEQEKDRRYTRRWIILAVAAIVVIVGSWVFTWVYPIACYFKKGCEL